MRFGMLVAVLLISLFHIGNLAAQESWTLEKCLAYAHLNSPRLKAAQKFIQETEGQAQAAASILYPQISWGGTYTKNSPAPFSGLGANLPAGKLRPSLISAQVYESALALNWTFFSWRIKPTLDIASASVNQAQEDSRQVKNDLSLDVKKAFFTVLFSQQLVNIATQAEQVARTNYETSEKLYKEGKVSHFDVSRAKVRLANSQSDLIDARNNYDIAVEGLKTLMSLPAEQEFGVVGRLPEETQEASLEDALNTAYAKRPELMSLNQLENLSVSSLNLEKAARLPSFSLSYNYSWQGRDLFINPDEYYKSWIFLGRIALPVFDGFLAKGRIRAARASLEGVRETKKQVLDAVGLEVRQAYLLLGGAKERISAQKENVTTAQENLRIATERYRMGLLSELELKDAELSLVDAETNYNRALYDYNVAWVSLQRAEGLE